MALLWFNGFDFLPTGNVDRGLCTTLGFYDSIYVQAGGRFGGKCAGGNGGNENITVFLPARLSHAVVGFASPVTPRGYGATHVLEFRVATKGAHLFLEFADYGVIKIRDYTSSYDYYGRIDGPVIAESDVGAYTSGPWNYYEVDCVIADNNAGFLTVRQNTIPIFSMANITTQNPGISNPSFNLVAWHASWPIDDVYICDDSGPAPFNGFLGNVRCQVLPPGGAGDLTQFAPSNVARANWQCASNPAIDDSLYVSSPTTTAEDVYKLQPLVNTPLVLAVQTRLAARQDDATQRFLESVLISGGVQIAGHQVALSQSYAFQTDIFTTDPATGASWLYPAVNALQVGPRVTG